MEAHGLETSNELAQVFRTSQTTASRWMRLARKLGPRESLETVLKGPANILFELMENGLETSDLRAMKALVQVRRDPKALDDLEWEKNWKVAIDPQGRQRQGASIVTKDGHEITVYSVWFRDRIAGLEKIEAEDDSSRRETAGKLVKRYRSALAKLAELPR
jgi:hypothetical protein